MAKNGLTILKKIIEEDFSTYAVKKIRNPADDHYGNCTWARYGFEIHTDDMYISFQHYDGLTMNIAVYSKDPLMKQFSYRILNSSYKETEKILQDVRDIIHDLTYEALDMEKVVFALVEYFKKIGDPEMMRCNLVPKM